MRPLLFGSLAPACSRLSSPILPFSVFYAVNLLNISAGSATTPGVNSIVFDSGATATFLVEPAYTQAKAAILAQVNLTWAADREGFEACYEKPGDGSVDMMEAVLSMVLHFDGGADMVWQVANYFFDVGDGVVCWIVQMSSSVSIIRHVMKMDFHVPHDVDKSVLSFQTANCDSL